MLSRYELTKNAWICEVRFHILGAPIRQDAERGLGLLAALEREMPEGATWTHPKGGFFIWVTLPDGVDAADLVTTARENLVDYIPGPAFYSDGSGRQSLRLSFSNVSGEQIDTGIARLAATVKAAIPVATPAD